jgi:hypothetical protein
MERLTSEARRRSLRGRDAQIVENCIPPWVQWSDSSDRPSESGSTAAIAVDGRAAPGSGTGRPQGRGSDSRAAPGSGTGLLRKRWVGSRNRRLEWRRSRGPGVRSLVPVLPLLRAGPFQSRSGLARKTRFPVARGDRRLRREPCDSRSGRYSETGPSGSVLRRLGGSRGRLRWRRAQRLVDRRVACDAPWAHASGASVRGAGPSRCTPRTQSCGFF